LWPESLGVAASLGVCAWQSGGHSERHYGGMQTRFRVTSVAQDTDDRRQRQDEALYSRALESIDLNRSTFCSTLHRFIWQRPPLFELSQQEECNTTAERAMGTSLCASLQAMSLHQVSDSAGNHTHCCGCTCLQTPVWLACRPTLRSSQPLLSEAALPV